MDFGGYGFDTNNSNIGLSLGDGGYGLSGGNLGGDLGNSLNEFGFDYSGPTDYGLGSGLDTGNYGLDLNNTGLGLGALGWGAEDSSVSPSGYADYSLNHPGEMSLGNPTGQAGFTSGISDNNSFGKKARNLAMKTFMAALSAKNPALGFALQAAMAGRSGRGGEMVGGRAGSMIGGGIAGPVGGYVGGQIGAAAGRGLDGRDQATGAGSAAVAGGFANPNTQGIGLGDIASLYAATRTNTTPFANTSSVNAGRDMSSIYGPTSQYATELRKQLERRDAASGRRSQYGPREVELMTKLSELEARQRNADSQTNIAERTQSYREQVEADNRRRQRDAALVRFLQGSGIASDIAGLF